MAVSGWPLMSFNVPVNFTRAGTTRSALASGSTIKGSEQQISKRQTDRRTLVRVIVLPFSFLVSFFRLRVHRHTAKSDPPDGAKDPASGCVSREVERSPRPSEAWTGHPAVKSGASAQRARDLLDHLF